jgi:hypothetical protein
VTAALGLLGWTAIGAVVDVDAGWWASHESAYDTLVDLGVSGALGAGGIAFVLAIIDTSTRPEGRRPWGLLVPVVFLPLFLAISVGVFALSGSAIGATDVRPDDVHRVRHQSPVSRGHSSPAPFWMDEGSTEPGPLVRPQQRSPTY